MIVVERLDALPLQGDAPVVATIGNFDGLHLGHQEIMRQVLARAAEIRGRGVVVTFDPHPLRILAPGNAPRLLMTRDQKLGQLEALGIDAVVTLAFDRALAGMPAESFARDVLCDRLRARELLIGADFRFGRGRAGDIDLLARLGEEHGFTASTIEHVLFEGERVSASRIRHALGEGRAADAAALLGRPFALIGTIVHGEGRGRSLLVPTANLAIENEFVPARGVYISRTRWPDRAHHGLTNVGIRPTFGDHRLVVESFLPGFTGDLYGQRVELDLLSRLRDERKFESPGDLMAQIEKDIRAFEEWRERHESTGPSPE
ncbi:MAG: bifunctional riboflavin kinase/FAD synthetase [Acidobacteriota bacterium]|nr:bifunctional riboflavin kinase/FAD synthetase [Acidobacteriota bacterium]